MPSDLPSPIMDAQNQVAALPFRIEPQIPALVVPAPTPKPSSFSEDMLESLKEVLHIWQDHLTRIFSPTPRRKIQAVPLQAPPAALAFPYVPNPESQELHARRQRVADQRLAQIQAQAEEQDLQLRSQSLLNTAVKMARPNQEPLAVCQEKLRALLEGSCATLSECAHVLGFRAADKISAIQEWQLSFEALRTACQQNPETGPIEHATAHYEALCALPEKPKGTSLRYSGAFGKKQCLIQALLTAGLPLAKHAATPLPPFLLESIQKGTLSDPETVLSFGFEIILEYLFQHETGPTLTRQFEETLDFLKPFLPDMSRHYEISDFLKSKIPTWLVEKDPDPIQQGLLSVLLDLVEDSALRDMCIDLLEKGSEFALAEDRKAVLAQCKQTLMKHALAMLPLPAIEALNQEMAQQLIFYLKEYAGPEIAQAFSSLLLSHGTYWFEWSYDPKTAYSLSIYTSGGALADENYPRQGDRPMWPIKMHTIALAPDMLKILTVLSTTTAVTNHWKKQENLTLKPREELFGENGLVAQFEDMGGQIDEINATTLEKSATLFSQMEMVSYFFQADKTPEYVRYEALRKQLLNTCAPLGVIPAPGRPPHLRLSAGEEGKTLLNLLQIATTATLQAAQRAKAGDQELQELTAFEKQLELELRKRTAAEAAHTSHLKNDEALGGLIDQVLPFLCQEAGQLHLLAQYKELLNFIFGPPAETFIEALCGRAEQFQSQINSAHPHPSSAQNPPQIAPAAANAQPAGASEHRKMGWIGQTLNHPSVRTFWFIYRTIHRIKGLSSLGWIGFLPPKLAAISPKFLGLKNFASHGWAGLLPELIGPISRAVLPQTMQDALHQIYTYLYAEAMRLIRWMLFKILFPPLTYTQFIQDLNAALSRLVNDAQALAPTYYPAVLLPPPVKAELLDHLADLLPQQELRAQRPTPSHESKHQDPGDQDLTFSIETHFWYEAQSKCERFLTARLTPSQDPHGQPTLRIPHLTEFLLDLTCLCQDLPHLLIEQIHKIPLKPNTKDFNLALPAHANEELDFEMALDIEKAIQRITKVGHHLFRTLFDGAFCVSFQKYQLAQHHLLALIDQLIRYLPDHPLQENSIYPKPLVEALSAYTRHASEESLYPLSPEHTKEVLGYFFTSVDAPHMQLDRLPTLKRYVIDATSKQLLLRILTTDSAPQSPDLMVHTLAQFKHYYFDNENPCGRAAALLHVQMLFCAGYGLIDAFETHLKSIIYREPNSDWEYYAHFWRQEAQGIGSSQKIEHPLTAPSRALRLIAHDPSYANIMFQDLWTLLFSTGHLEDDLKHNPELIEHYAKALKALIVAAGIEQKPQAYKLALALRNRVWAVDPHTKAFAFLGEQIDILLKTAPLEAQWKCLALKTLYQDHPAPKALSKEVQRETLTFLFHALNAFEKRIKEKREDLSYPWLSDCHYFTDLQEMALRWQSVLPLHAHQRFPVITVSNAPAPLDEPPPQLLQREINGVTYTRLTTRASNKLLELLSSQFPWITALKSYDTECYTLGARQHPEDGSRATLLITRSKPSQEEQLFFVLEGQSQSYQLMGMVDAPGKQIVHPAPRSQADSFFNTHCLPWMGFCPLSCMQLLVNRETGLLSHCHMALFNLDFSLKETPIGWRGENSQHFPGFWIAQKQSVPFGLILENAQSKKQLLLPGNTLLHQTLYAQLDPLFGILGNFVQRQELLHQKGSFYCYRLTETPYLKDAWVSDEPNAMVHLLLLYCSYRQKEQMLQAGLALLRMPLPQSMEIELLPLQFYPDPDIQQLYAELLAHLETSFITKSATETPGVIAQYLPQELIQLVSCINAYRLIVSDTSRELEDRIFHNLAGRYKRLIHTNEAVLTHFLRYKCVKTLLNTDWIALHILPTHVQERIARLESALGNRPGSMQRAIDVTYTWYNLPHAKILSHPLASQMVLSQGLFNYIVSPMRHLVRPEWFGKIIRSLPRLTRSQSDMPLEMLSGLLISKMQPRTDQFTPDLSKETLIPHFFAYLAISEGKLGIDKQKELVKHARALYFFTEGIEKQLLETLLTVSTHTYQYTLFERLQKRKKPKKTLKPQKGQLSAAEKQQRELEHTHLMKLQTAVSFRQQQPLCQHVQTVSTYSLALMGTFYMLTIGSEYAFKATSEMVTPYMAESAHMLIPASFLLSIASLLQNTSQYSAVKDVTIKGARALASTSHLSFPTSFKKHLNPPHAILKTFPKMRSVARRTAQLSQAALTLFTIHCVNAYTAYAAQPLVTLLYGNTTVLPNNTMLLSNHTNNSLTCESPQDVASTDMSLSTIMMIMIGLIPTFKRLYDIMTFLHVAKSSSLKLQQTPVLLLQDSTPCISLECQQALHAEDRRFRGDLNAHFDTCFETHEIAQDPVTMDFVQSEKIKQALAIYARRPEANVRTVFSLRSLDALDHLRAHIESQLAKVEYMHTRALNDLFSVLGIAKEDQGMCMQAFYHFFAVQNAHALKAYKIDLYEQNKLQKILPTLFLQETQKQQLQKIAKPLQALKNLDAVTHTAEWESACDELIMQMRAQREYDLSSLDPKYLAFFLAFESRTNTLLWKKQIQTMLTVLNAREASVAYELLMSLGKTFFAVPTTALLHADGSRAVFIVLPPDVYLPQTRAISEQIFLLAGRYLSQLTIDRNFPLTEEHLDGLLRLIENTKRGKGVISTRSHDLRALELLLFTQLETFAQKTFLAPWENRQLEQLKNILLTIFEKSAFVCDELHALFDDPPLNFPVGPKVKLDKYEAQSVRKTVGALLKGPLGKILSKYTHLNAHPDSKKIFEQEQERVARYVVAKSVCGHIPPHHRQSVIEYLLDTKKQSPDFLPPEQLNAIDAARGVLLSLFPLTLTRIMGSHFGRSKKHPRLREVLPYTGHDNPAESRRFTTGLEALTKTLVNTWHHGLSLQDFKDLLEVCYTRSVKWTRDNKLPIARAPEAKAFAKLFPRQAQETLESTYQKINQNEALQALLSTLQPSVKLLLLYSRLKSEPTLAYQQAQVTSTAHNFIDMSTLKIGGSGTLYNKDGYSLGMQRQLDKTTEGAALTNIKRKCRGVVSLTHDTPQEILQEVIETFFVSDIAAGALLDGGALLTGLSHKYIAEVLLTEVRKKRSHIETVHFFTIDVESGEPVCMSLMHGKEEPIPKHTCSTLPENTLTFLDEARCFAADVPQPKNGIGVWLVGAQQPLHHGEQTTHRLRGIKETIKFIGLKQEGERLPSAAQLAQKDLNHTQSLYMALSKQVSRSIYSAGYQTITPEHVLDYGAARTQVDEKPLNLKMALSMLQSALRTPLKNALLKASSVSKMREHYKAGRSVFLQKTPQEASQLYGGAHVNVSGETIFLARYKQAFKQIQEHPLLSDEEKHKAIKDLEAVLAHVLSLSLPQDIPARVNVEGTYLLDSEHLEQGQEVEQNHDVEKEEENETLVQLQQQKQVQLAKPLSPLNVPLAPWSDTSPLDSKQWQWSDELLKANFSTLSRLKVNFSAVKKHLQAAIKQPKNALQPASTPPLFKVETLLQNATEKALRLLSKVIDKRLWWSNNLLPQLQLSLRTRPAQMATGQQHPIVHLLIEVELGAHDNPDTIVSVGCLHPSEANYWLKRLHTEQEHARAEDKLFMLYQLPVLRNSEPDACYDGAVLAYNRSTHWKPEESLDFQIMEVMIKFCNGDIYYTDEQRALLKTWKQHSYGVVADPKTLDHAFDAFYSMARQRLGLEQVVTLKDILDPTHDDMSV